MPGISLKWLCGMKIVANMKAQALIRVSTNGVRKIGGGNVAEWVIDGYDENIIFFAIIQPCRSGKW